MPNRTYLDWNATAPLRPEARAAMIAAMDVVGNPSSVHTEGRAAKMMIEKAREQVAALVGCDSIEVVFTSGATEAAEHALSQFYSHTHWVADDVDLKLEYEVRRSELTSRTLMVSGIEHDCVAKHSMTGSDLSVFSNGIVRWDIVEKLEYEGTDLRCLSFQAANSETGVVQNLEKLSNANQNRRAPLPFFSDVAQIAGKQPISLIPLGIDLIAISSHKFGGPKGVGALLVKSTFESAPLITGGGQEKGRRSGTENVIGIAGFGAAAEAAQRDLDAGAWEPIEELRNDLESALRDCAGDDLTIFGESAPRLPNTSCFAIPGWKGETQVMQLDLAGFAVSAGSACSSGKVGPSRVLKAMGFDDNTASSAIRVSMGTTTTKDEVSRFIDAWTALYQRMKTRAA